MRLTTLSAAQGMQEAMLTPRPENRFGIAVDPTPMGGWGEVSPTLAGNLRRQRARFRACHELAHTLFYRRTVGQTPRRRVYDSPGQETFCDAVASNLLVPREMARELAGTTAGLLELQQACEVSLEVAARSLADARPDLAISIWFGPSEEELMLQWSTHPDQGLERTGEASWLGDRGQLLVVSQACSSSTGSGSM